MKIAINFKKIAAETGVRRGNIFYSPTWKNWVVAGHPDIDLICIDPPTEIINALNGRGIDSIIIKNDNWTLTDQ